MQGPDHLGGAGSFYRAFGETLRGLKTTLRQSVAPVSVIAYPEEKIPVYPRWRGRHRLHKFEDGLEKSIKGLTTIEELLRVTRLTPR